MDHIEEIATMVERSRSRLLAAFLVAGKGSSTPGRRAPVARRNGPGRRGALASRSGLAANVARALISRTPGASVAVKSAKAPETVRLASAAIAYVHKLRREPSPITDGGREAVKGLANKAAHRGKGQARPITRDEFAAIVAHARRGEPLKVGRHTETAATTKPPAWSATVTRARLPSAGRSRSISRWFRRANLPAPFAGPFL